MLHDIIYLFIFFSCLLSIAFPFYYKNKVKLLEKKRDKKFYFILNFPYFI